jgi:hypothetical protein
LAPPNGSTNQPPLGIFIYPKFGIEVFLRLRFFGKMSLMETVEYFSDFLRKIGAPNFLAIGIVLIVLWLLISGIRKGLRKGRQNKESEEKHHRD